MADLYKLIGKKDVNLTISYGSEILIKNESDLIHMFNTHQGAEDIHLFVKKNADNPALTMVIPSQWDVVSVKSHVGEEVVEGRGVVEGRAIEEDVGVQVAGEF